MHIKFIATCYNDNIINLFLFQYEKLVGKKYKYGQKIKKQLCNKQIEKSHNFLKLWDYV